MRNSSYALRDKAGLGPACASPRRLRLLKFKRCPDVSPEDETAGN